MKHGKQLAKLCCIVMVGIISFTTFYHVGTSVFGGKTISDNEFELYEQVAQKVFEQKSGKLLADVPEEIEIEKSDRSIKVYSNDIMKLGYVVAKLQQDKLVFERNLDKDRNRDFYIMMSAYLSLLCMTYCWIRFE